MVYYEYSEGDNEYDNEDIMPGWKSRSRRNDKRKKSSDSSEIQNKSSRVGGSPGGQTVSDDETSIVDILRQSNDILYNSNDHDSSLRDGVDPDTSVFDQVETVVSAEPVSGGGGVEQGEQVEQGAMATGQEKSTDKATLDDVMVVLRAMNVRMEKMDKKLERLDSVEKKVDRFDSELKLLWTRIHDNNKKLDERLLNVEEKLDSRDMAAGVLSDRVQQLQKEADRARSDLLYIQSQSMRNNLVFSNIPEDTRESGEESERKIRSFLVEKLKMARETVEEIKFERVHRMGASVGGKPRQVVAKFCFFKDREMVKKERAKLKGTNFFISEQFPKEIAEKRKRLLPKMWEARNNGKTAWIAYDTLYIDNVAVKDRGQ